MKTSHSQLLQVLQAVEGALGNRSDLRLAHFPVETETAAHITPRPISDTPATGMYSLNTTPEKVPDFAVFWGTARLAGPRPVTHSGWGFSFHARSKLFSVQNVST